MEIKNAIGLKEVYKLYLKCRRIQRLYTDKEESLHNDPMLKGVINLLVKQFNIANIIETGTYLGFTTKYFKLNYPNVNVTSIEKDERTFVKASNNLKDAGFYLSYQVTRYRFAVGFFFLHPLTS